MDYIEKRYSVLLKVLMGLVFISAGAYRIFNWPQAVAEFSALNLNYPFLIVFTIILEVGGGLMLIFNKGSSFALKALCAFISIALFASLFSHGQEIISGYRQLFSFDANPTDFLLHLNYLIILVYLLLVQKSSK